MSTGKGAVVINLEIIIRKYGKGDHMLGDLKEGVIELEDCHNEVCIAVYTTAVLKCDHYYTF